MGLFHKRFSIILSGLIGPRRIMREKQFLFIELAITA
jgi:hypothetical protein